jgi:hypothetical protein
VVLLYTATQAEEIRRLREAVESMSDELRQEVQRLLGVANDRREECHRRAEELRRAQDCEGDISIGCRNLDQGHSATECHKHMAEQIRLLQKVILEAEIGTFEGYDIALSAAKKAGAYATEDAQQQGGE